MAYRITHVLMTVIGVYFSVFTAAAFTSERQIVLKEPQLLISTHPFNANKVSIPL